MLQSLSKILDESIIVGITVRDGQRLPTRILSPEDIPTLDAETIMYMRSWRGTFDRSYQR